MPSLLIRKGWSTLKWGRVTRATMRLRLTPYSLYLTRLRALQNDEREREYEI